MHSHPLPPKQTASILIMDDEANIRILVERLLKRFGHQVTLTGNGQEAVDAWKTAKENQTPFDLAILDLNVPGAMGGITAAQKILKIDPMAKLVVSSGYANDPLMIEYARHGLMGALPKPFRLTDMTEAVNRLIF